MVAPLNSNEIGTTWRNSSKIRAKGIFFQDSEKLSYERY